MIRILVMNDSHTYTSSNRLFNHEVYEALLDKLSLLYSDPHLKERQKENNLLYLTASIPFIAKCRQPERVALANMNTYCLISSKKTKTSLFLHNRHDDSNPLSRIELMDNYPDGDRQIIERGLALLALVMIQDYHKDRQNDKDTGKYNPLNSGVWNYKETRDSLIEKIQSISCVEMEAVFPLATAQSQDFWKET